MTDDVVIVGGGPNGLMLAGELALAGVRPVVLERLTERSAEPKANGVIGQVIRLLDHRGLYERLDGAAEAPQPIPAFIFAALPLDLRRLDTNPMYGLGIRQQQLERVLEERATELGVRIQRGHELLTLCPDEDAVTLQVRGPQGNYRRRTRYLVGCDGAHSTVRKQAGIAFPGVTATDTVSRAAHVTVPGSVPVPGTAELEVPGGGRIGLYTWHRTERGAYLVMPVASGVLIVGTVEWGGRPDDEDLPMTLEEMRASLRRVLGAELAIAAPPTAGHQLLRRLVDRNTRLVETYRKGRVLVVGDAAHVHSAIGAPGLNLGLHDAVNLGWKLAAQIQGRAPAGLVDTYHTERRPAAERVVMHTQAQLALMAPNSGITELRELFGELLQDTGATQRIADLLAGADVRYPMAVGAAGEAPHPLVGWLAPDLELTVAGSPTRLAVLLRTARPLLLDLVGDRTLHAVAAGWTDRVDLLIAECDRPPAAALLIRPDGYVAWAAPTQRSGDFPSDDFPSDDFPSDDFPSDDFPSDVPTDVHGDVHRGLEQALTTWFRTGHPA